MFLIISSSRLITNCFFSLLKRFLTKLNKFFAYKLEAVKGNLFITFDIPIISIGNIAMGGTGKTPMTSWLVEYLLTIGKKPCIVTRGYNRVNNKMIIVNPREKKS